MEEITSQKIPVYFLKVEIHCDERQDNYNIL